MLSTFERRRALFSTLPVRLTRRLDQIVNEHGAGHWREGTYQDIQELSKLPMLEHRKAADDLIFACIRVCAEVKAERARARQ